MHGQTFLLHLTSKFENKEEHKCGLKMGIKEFIPIDRSDLGMEFLS